MSMKQDKDIQQFHRYTLAHSWYYLDELDISGVLVLSKGQQAKLRTMLRQYYCSAGHGRTALAYRLTRPEGYPMVPRNKKGDLSMLSFDMIPKEAMDYLDFQIKLIGIDPTAEDSHFVAYEVEAPGAKTPRYRSALYVRYLTDEQRELFFAGINTFYKGLWAAIDSNPECAAMKAEALAKVRGEYRLHGRTE